MKYESRARREILARQLGIAAHAARTRPKVGKLKRRTPGQHFTTPRPWIRAVFLCAASVQRRLAASASPGEHRIGLGELAFGIASSLIPGQPSGRRGELVGDPARVPRCRASPEEVEDSRNHPRPGMARTDAEESDLGGKGFWIIQAGANRLALPSA